ncbi:hypothetical protein I547_3941 [Mycobacterium kansasii 824]|nr:hypothetical protein I547_3941 [Mycobacterium kansasii 824]
MASDPRPSRGSPATDIQCDYVVVGTGSAGRSWPIGSAKIRRPR